jgi:phage/plasmid-like protein (TIGR03299 family)
MAHELDMTTGRVGMAFVGETPWHGLGHKLLPGADIETWRQVAGLNWSVLEAPVLFHDPQKAAGTMSTVIGQKVLYRDDTRNPLSIVSTGYVPAQPSEILAFMQEVVDIGGFQLETAGSIRGGCRIWALAKMTDGVEIVPGDKVRPYLLIATSFDKSMATTAKRTAIRVVCNNTLSAAAGDHMAKGSVEPEVKVYHSMKFDDKVRADVRKQLDQAVAGFDQFVTSAKRLADETISDRIVDSFLLNLYRTEQNNPDLVEKTRKSKGYKRIAEMFATGDNNPGHDMAGKTLWGLINSVTRYVDFERGASRETALDSAWFGEGDALKSRAFQLASELVETV